VGKPIPVRARVWVRKARKCDGAVSQRLMALSFETNSNNNDTKGIAVKLTSKCKDYWRED